jgi:hypothetical protein
VTATAIVLMPLLGVAKRRLGATLNSADTAGEERRIFAAGTCRRPSLAGTGTQRRVRALWADPVAALFVAGVAVKEGRESCRGESCCEL